MNTSEPRIAVNGAVARASRNGKKRVQQSVYAASVYGGINPELPAPFVHAVHGLETTLQMPVWLLVQRHHPNEEFHEIDNNLVEALIANRRDLPEGSPVALLIHSPGGYASCAYQIANALRNHCGKFVAIIPRWAKSAATLLALGAEQIVLGRDGELGATRRAAAGSRARDGIVGAGRSAVARTAPRVRP